MLLPSPGDTLHKAMLYRVLAAIADDIELANMLRFKGGTCAAMMGYLNRFSVDLDFDFIVSDPRQKADIVRKRIMGLIINLGFEIHDFSKIGIQFFLKYKAPPEKRNTLKIDVSFPAPINSLGTSYYFADIDRTLGCNTIEDMFANKLVSILDRYEKHGSLAGRDIYDIHEFFLQDLKYHAPIIEERRQVKTSTFFGELITFIKKHFTEKILTQDLNVLLPLDEFQRVKKILIPETIRLLEDAEKYALKPRQ